MAKLTVNVSPAGANEVKSSPCEVYASDKVIHIVCDDAADIMVFDTVGNVLSRGDKNVTVLCSGVYIVSVNGSVSKIMVK